MLERGCMRSNSFGFERSFQIREVIHTPSFFIVWIAVPAAVPLIVWIERRYASDK